MFTLCILSIQTTNSNKAFSPLPIGEELITQSLDIIY